jgi:non-reducing end alpha-L-arabinofuranosidase
MKATSFFGLVLGVGLGSCGGHTAIGEGPGLDAGGSSSGVPAAGATSGVGASAGRDAPGNAGSSAAGRGGTSAAGGTSATGGSEATAGRGPGRAGALPGEVLEAAGHPSVAAHSTVRVLIDGYTGSLYRVQRDDGKALDIGAVDGFADAEAQVAFCRNARCVIETIYDQSPMGNHVTVAPPGSAKPTPSSPVNAGALPVTIAGRQVFGILFRPGQGYRKLVGNGTARGDEPQTIYMVTSQHDLINGCCFDYGNAETTAENDGNGAAEAVYFGMGVIWGTGVGEGPWVMADLENGLFPGWENGQSSNISTNTPLQHDFVTAVLVGDTADKNRGRGRFALYGGDAARGAVRTMYDGVRPEKPGYVPMSKQGSVVLGVAGDNSDSDGGRFYEGVIANGAASKATVDALQAAIVEAGYGR